MRLILLVTSLFFTFSTLANTQQFSSGVHQTQLLELYTSQGCSSCPPAEKWLTKFMKKDKLWQQIVPVNFHVDYWDNLGWPDRYASSRFTQRQRIYKALGNTTVVATPGFVINGRGWHGWFYGQKLPKLAAQKVGELSLKISTKEFQAQFKPHRLTGRKFKLNIAQLGFGLFDKIQRGENEGKLLRHDFVVLSFQQLTLKEHQGNFSITSQFSKPVATSPVMGVAAWITADNNPTPIQSVGGYLK